MQKDLELILDATSNPGDINSQCSCTECDTDGCCMKRLDKSYSCSRSENFNHMKNNKYTTKVYITKAPQGKQNAIGNENEGYDVIKEVQEIVYGINKHNKPKILRETSTKIMKLKTINPSAYNTRESKNVKSCIHSFPTVGNTEKSPSSENVSCHKNNDKEEKNYNDDVKEIANGIISSILSFPIKDLPDKVRKDNLSYMKSNIEAFQSISESEKSNTKDLCKSPLLGINQSLQSMNQKPKRKDSFRKDATATALTAEVMNLPYKEFQTSISRPIVSSGKPHLSALDIINKIKEAYEACSCRVCECILGKPLQNELCSCKPCECNYCANVNKCILSNTGSKLIPKYYKSYLNNRCSNIESSSFGRLGQIDLDNNRKHDPNRFTKNSDFCDCEPCQCMECTARPIHRTFKVESVGGELQYRGGYQCSPCECFECAHSLGVTSFGQHKISTSFNRKKSYHHDMLVNEACIPNGSQNCRCESQSKVLYKPIEQESHDFDTSTENVAFNKRTMRSDNFETVTMFAALENTCHKNHGRECECDQCECLKGKRDQYSPRSLIQEGFFNSSGYDDNNIAPLQIHKGQTCCHDGIYCKTYKNAIHNNKTQSPQFDTINQKSTQFYTRNALSSDNIEANVKESQHLQNNVCKSQNFSVQLIDSSKEKQSTHTSYKENHDHYQNIFETGSICGCQTYNNAESTFEEEYKKVQDILQETLKFIQRLVQLVNKCENASKEIKRRSEKTHNANYSLNDKIEILKFVSSKSNLKDTFDKHEVPTKDSKKASMSLTNELFTRVKDTENLRALSLEETTNTVNSCTFRNATLEHNIKRRNECNKDFIKPNNIIPNTITENNDSMDIVHKHNLVTVNKLNKTYDQTCKRSRKLTEESKNFYKTSFTERYINEAKTNQIFDDHESFQETQKKESNCMALLHDRKSVAINIDGDFYDGYLPKIAESTNLLRLVTKPTTEIINLNNSIIENNTNGNGLELIKEVVTMFKQPMEEQNEGTAVVKPRSDEPLVLKKKLDIEISTEPIRPVFRLPTPCERDVKAVSEMIAKQAPDENATYIYDRTSNTDLNAQNTLNCEAMKVIGLNARRVSHHSVLVKWKAPRSLDNVEGYEVLVDGCSVQKILNPFHRMAVISCLPHTDKLLLTVRTVTDVTDHYPATTLVYHMRKQH